MQKVYIGNVLLQALTGQRFIVYYKAVKHDKVKSKNEKKTAVTHNSLLTTHNSQFTTHFFGEAQRDL